MIVAVSSRRSTPGTAWRSARPVQAAARGPAVHDGWRGLDEVLLEPVHGEDRTSITDVIISDQARI